MTNDYFQPAPPMFHHIFPKKQYNNLFPHSDTPRFWPVYYPIAISRIPPGYSTASFGYTVCQQNDKADRIPLFPSALPDYGD